MPRVETARLDLTLPKGALASLRDLAGQRRIGASTLAAAYLIEAIEAELGGGSAIRATLRRMAEQMVAVSERTQRLTALLEQPSPDALPGAADRPPSLAVDTDLERIFGPRPQL